MTGIYSNGYVEVMAFRLGYDITRPYWFKALQELKMLNIKLKDNKCIIEIFNQEHIVDSPYIFRDINRLVFMEGNLFYKTFESKRPYREMDSIEDELLIKRLMEEGIMLDKYFEILNMCF